MIEKIRWYMEEQHMAGPGSRIVVGVSGGADSICLLHVLALLAPSFQWKLAVVHVNHLIRREAGEDAAYVEETCRRLGVSFYLTEVDVEALAKSRGLSVEEAGRQVRYRAFYEAAESFGADRIAVAHNRNDRAETLLFICSAGQAWTAWHPSGRCGITSSGPFFAWEGKRLNSGSGKKISAGV